MPQVYQDRTLAVIRHQVEMWEAEVAWALRLRDEERLRAETEPAGTSSNESNE